MHKLAWLLWRTICDYLEKSKVHNLFSRTILHLAPFATKSHKMMTRIFIATFLVTGKKLKTIQISTNKTRKFSHSVVSDSLQPHGLQHARLPCPSSTPGLIKLMFMESVIPSNCSILCHPFSFRLQHPSQHQGLFQ